MESNVRTAKKTSFHCVDKEIAIQQSDHDNKTRLIPLWFDEEAELMNEPPDHYECEKCHTIHYASQYKNQICPSCGRKIKTILWR